MTRPRTLSAAALCGAVLLAAAPLAASAVDAAAPGKAPAPRVGSYKIVKRGPHAIRARCLEGGNVLVPTHEKATAAERDRDIHEACKTVDYTK